MVSCEWIQLRQIKKKKKTGTLRQTQKKKKEKVLTVTSSHSSIVVGHSNEVINVGPSLGVTHKLRHVQVSEKNERKNKKTNTCVTSTVKLNFS